MCQVKKLQVIALWIHHISWTNVYGLIWHGVNMAWHGMVHCNHVIKKWFITSVVVYNLKITQQTLVYVYMYFHFLRLFSLLAMDGDRDGVWKGLDRLVVSFIITQIYHPSSLLFFVPIMFFVHSFFNRKSYKRIEIRIAIA